jgi:Kef-type K+ transport system membrane component KefB
MTDDVTAWCLLAFVVGVVQAQVGAGLLVAAGTLAYITLMFVLVRPLLRRVVTTLATAPVLQVLMPSTAAEDASERAPSCHC